MNNRALTEAVCQDIFDQFPEETSKYKELIKDSIYKIMQALPDGFSRERYVEAIRKALTTVSHGALKGHH